MADKSYNRGVHTVFGSVATFTSGKEKASSITRTGRYIYLVDCQKLESTSPKITRTMIEYATAAEAADAMPTLIQNKRMEFASA